MNKWDRNNIITFINNTGKYNFIDFIEYNGIYSMVKIKCVKNKNHGEFISKFANIKNNEKRNGTCCKECKKENLSKKNRLDYNTVKNNIESEGYTLISKGYKNNNEKLEIKCPKCNDIFLMTYNNFHNQKQRCPKCSYKEKFENQKLSYEYIKDKIEKENYVLLSKEYKGCWEDLKIKCLKHDFVFYKNWHSFQQGKKCPKCGLEHRSEKQKHDISYIKEYINSYGDALLSDKYENNSKKLKIKCDKGHIFYMSFVTYTQGHRCPICNISKGEKRVSEILNKYKIEYIPQKSFKDCKFKKKLPFDFYLLQYKILIEYDGIGHYEIVNWCKNKNKAFDNFINTKIRDTVKNKFCKDNNIKLIRIPYWEYDNIEKILIKELDLI